MQRLFLIICIFLSLNFVYLPQSFAVDKTQNAEISKIENDIYGFDYNNDDLKNRVARLEKSIYGKASTGDIASRIKKMAADITAEQIGLEIPPSEDTFREDEELADSTVHYPIVDEVEKKLFNQTYANRDFHSRIVAIERKLFGKIYDVEDYSTRMDRIKTAALPSTTANQNALSSETLSSEFDDLDNNRYSRMPYGQRNYTRPYANYGEYANEFSNPINIDDELAKMEYSTFGTEFSGDDTKTRLQRLNSVNRAKKSSSKYDSQKFQQRMSTAMEIGAMILMILAMVL